MNHTLLLLQLCQNRPKDYVRISKENGAIQAKKELHLFAKVRINVNYVANYEI